MVTELYLKALKSNYRPLYAFVPTKYVAFVDGYVVSWHNHLSKHNEVSVTVSRNGGFVAHANVVKHEDTL